MVGGVESPDHTGHLNCCVELLNISMLNCIGVQRYVSDSSLSSVVGVCVIVNEQVSRQHNWLTIPWKLFSM